MVYSNLKLKCSDLDERVTDQEVIESPTGVSIYTRNSNANAKHFDANVFKSPLTR